MKTHVKISPIYSETYLLEPYLKKWLIFSALIGIAIQILSLNKIIHGDKIFDFQI